MLLDVSAFKYYRMNHSKLFANKQNHMNGFENFRNQSQRYMRRFNGIPREGFYLFLRVCERQFNRPGSKSKLRIINKSSGRF